MTNKRVDLAVVTIRREAFGELLPFFEDACLHKLIDKNGKLGTLLNKIWEDFTAPTPRTNFKKQNKKYYQFYVPLAKKRNHKHLYFQKKGGGEEID